MFKTRKVVIVGAGHVGSHVALALIQSGEADDIVLIDILKEKAIGQALDLDDCVSGSLCGKDVSIRAGSYEELHDAEIMSWPLAAAVDPVRPGWICSTIRQNGQRSCFTFKTGRFSRYHDQYFQSCGHHLRIHPPADGLAAFRCFCTGTSLETYRLLRVISKATGLQPPFYSRLLYG